MNAKLLSLSALAAALTLFTGCDVDPELEAEVRAELAAELAEVLAEQSPEPSAVPSAEEFEELLLQGEVPTSLPDPELECVQAYCSHPELPQSCHDLAPLVPDLCIVVQADDASLDGACQGFDYITASCHEVEPQGPT